jgi:outer membrane biosynthesis protein TonB
MPPGVAGRLVVRILVKADGTLERVERLSALDAPGEFVKLLDEQVEAGIRSCAFEPGRDAEGRPQDIWLILPIRFAW